VKPEAAEASEVVGQIGGARMDSFVKAVEVWGPRKGSMELEFIAGSYGALTAFRAASEKERFGFDVGLPGKAWAQRHPLLMHTDSAYFQRANAAKDAGITTAIAYPVFSGDYLMGVAVFLCGDDARSAGAIEVWHCDTTASYDLCLLDGHFGKLEHFASVSRTTAFRQGTGLPGRVWESGMPLVMKDLGTSHQFIRYESALKAGITTGLGLPFFDDPQQVFLMTFLSALSTPIAKQIEIWLPDAARRSLSFSSGYSAAGRDLPSLYGDVRLDTRKTSLGRALFSGMPVVSEDIAGEGANTVELGLRTAIAIPVLERGRCKAVVAMYN
jgi:hypothetical protein